MREADQLQFHGGEFYPATGTRSGRCVPGGMRGNALREIEFILDTEGPGAFPPAARRPPVRVPGLRFGAREDGTEWWFVPITLHGERIGGLERAQDEPGASWYGVDCPERWEDLREIDEPTLAGAKREARRIVAAVLSAESE